MLCAINTDIMFMLTRGDMFLDMENQPSPTTGITIKPQNYSFYTLIEKYIFSLDLMKPP